MNPIDHRDERLESFTSIKHLLRFIFHTYDGRYLMILSIIYFLWGIYTLLQSSGDTPQNSLALLLYPILLLVAYLKHRIGTLSSELTPSIFSFISLTALATVPIYIIFWS